MKWTATLLGGLLLMGAAGCATTDDPREGGLIGYLRHGEQGYQDRLDRRQGEVDTVREETAAAEAETNRLQQRRNEAQAELARQREALAALTEEVDALRAVCAEAETASPEAEVEQRRLVEGADGLQQEIEALEQDTELLIRDRERRISELSKELKLLREQASLLTTL